MSFKFVPGEKLQAGVRRIATEQVESALADALADADPAAAVHSARKRSKRLRGLIRLVRPGFRDFARENAAIRDAARMLSVSRDAEVLNATLSGLLRRLRPEQAEALAPLAASLREGHRDEDGEESAAERLRRFGWAMQALKERIGRWELKEDQFGAARRGLRLTARDMRDAMEKADRTGRPDDFHEWRKHAKYHWHHLCLLRDTAPHVLRGARDAAGELAEMLGAHHDLAVLAERLEQPLADVPAQLDLSPLKEQIALEIGSLAHKALALGRELSAERPALFARRLAAYWSAAPAAS